MEIIKIRNFVQNYSKDFKRINNTSYIINYNDGSTRFLIAKTKYNLAWERLYSFYQTFPDIRIYFQRIIDNYRLTSILNIGAKYYGHYIIDDEILIIITEYLPNELTQEIVDISKNLIITMIKNFHALGIYHGDLHSKNIRISSNNELKLIDMETMFYTDDFKLQLINEWIILFFGKMTMEEFIIYEETNPLEIMDE